MFGRRRVEPRPQASASQFKMTVMRIFSIVVLGITVVAFGFTQVKIKDAKELEGLLRADAYAKHVGE